MTDKRLTNVVVCMVVATISFVAGGFLGMTSSKSSRIALTNRNAELEAGRELDHKTLVSLRTDMDLDREALKSLRADMDHSAETIRAQEGIIEGKQTEIQEHLERIAEMESAPYPAKDSEHGKLLVVAARFQYTHGVLGDEPEIILTVRNWRGPAISRAYFHAVLTSPGRSVPWVEEDFNYSIAGGLEPGEGDTWHLAPNTFLSDWKKAPKHRDDLVLNVTVVRIEDADGNVIPER